MIYRTTPRPVTGKAPSELIFGRQIRTRLDLLHSSQKEVCQQTRKRQEKGNKRKPRELEVGDSVWYCGTEKWIPGVVVSKAGPLSYTVSANNQERRSVHVVAVMHACYCLID